MEQFPTSGPINPSELTSELMNKKAFLVCLNGLWLSFYEVVRLQTQM